MNRRGKYNKCNNNVNENVSFDKDHIILKEACAALTPELKEFWNSMHNKYKASTLEIEREIPKHKPPFAIKSSNSEIEALLHQHLKFDEDNNTEDDTTPEESKDQDNPILVNYATAKNTNLSDMYSLLSATHKKKPNS